MWNPLEQLLGRISGNGGFVNAHAHFDWAYSVGVEHFAQDGGSPIHNTLREKWQLVDTFKQQATEELYFQHICTALRLQRNQGVRCCLSFIDCDPITKDRALRAALRAKTFVAQEWGMRFLIACQTLKGVVSPDARAFFEQSLDFIDIIGGLPRADPGREREHLDILFQAAKRTKKRVHVQVDQLNLPTEKETEFLAQRVMHWGLEGQVTAIHGISIGAHQKAYRHMLYQMCKDAGLSFVACPTAWIDSKRNETLTPTHNAITPLDELLPRGFVVALGSDHICDLLKPYADGNLTTELRMLLEATHVYDMLELVKVATSHGRTVLGLDAKCTTSC
jgi:cytosine deaminase